MNLARANGIFGGGRVTGRGLQTLVTPQLVLLSIGFSVLIDAISGLLPARRAANLQPVEALRYQ